MSTLLTGPVYPAPGGNTFSSNGQSSGRDAGQVRTYGGFDLTKIDSVYWGLDAVKTAMDGLVDSPSETLSLASISADGLTATWTGATGAPGFGGTVYTQLVVSIVAATSGAARWVTAGSLGYSTGPAAFVDIDETIGSFQVKLQYQAATSPTGPWDSFLDVYDAITTAGGGAISSSSGLFVAHEIPTNAPPVSDPIATQHVNEDAAWSFAVPAGTFSDPDGDTLSFTATLGNGDPLPAWLAFDAATQTFTGTPPQDFSGDLSFKVAASDGEFSTSQTFTLTVDPINDAPTITSNGGVDVALVSLAENTKAVATVQASDVEGDGLTYSIAGGADAALFEIDAVTGALSFKAAPNFERPADASLDNVYDVIVSASDGQLSDLQALAVTVTDVADTSSSKPAYLLSSNPNVSVQAIITTGDATSKVGGGTYLFGGIPDGLGMFDNGDGTVTVLVNHELANTLGTVRDHGAKGTYVSELVIDKATLQVISGQDAIQTLKIWDAASGAYVVSNLALSRFCSADLPSQSALYNAADGLGSQAKIFFTGEESGAEGKQLAVVLTGPEAGTAYELPRLGKFAHENAVANPLAQDKTIVMGTDDAGGGKGQVYVYVGTKTSTGTEVDKAGLTNGVLYGIAVTGLTQEGSTTNLNNAAFTLAPLGDVTNLTGAQLDTASNAAGVTNFLRPEDIAWDPTNPARGYFVTTDSVSANGTAGTFHSRLYQFTFTDLQHPELGGTITAVLDGTEGQVMFDNLTVDAQGIVTLNEDPGNNVRIGRVWQYNPTTDQLTELAHHDPALFLQAADPNQPGYVPNPATYLTQDEESSGVIDVTATFGDAHHKAFLVTSQSHLAATGPNAATLVEGGQLQLITQYVNTAPVLTGTQATLAHGTEDTAYTVTLGDLLAGFSDAEGDALAVTGLTSNHGSVVDNGDGTFTITPAANYFGSATLSYTVTDGLGGTAAASLGYVIDEVVDTFTGTGGNDNLTGTTGADVLIGLAGNDRLDGGAGNDTASYAGAGAVVVDLRLALPQATGGAGRDTLVSIENLIGSSNNDRLTGDNNANTLDGGDGVDKLYGVGGNDHLLGGAGNDLLDGGSGADTMEGGIGNDTYYVDNLGDVVIESAAGGTDTVYSDVNFTLSDNVEKLYLTSGQSKIGIGNALANTIQASDASATLSGLAGNDTIKGGAGADTLTGGFGKDMLTGGAGADTFVFDVFETSANRDTVTDFVAGTDKIALSVAAYTSLAGYGLGALDNGELAIGPAANVPGQHLIYNNVNGALYYDADGFGGAAQVQIATISGHPALTASDFILI